MSIKPTNKASGERLMGSVPMDIGLQKMSGRVGDLSPSKTSQPARTPSKNANPCFDCEFWDESFSKMEETGLCRITNRCIDGTKTCKDFKRRQGE